MQCLEVSGAVRLIYRSLGIKGLSLNRWVNHQPGFPGDVLTVK